MGYSIETIINTLDQIDGRTVRATVKINTDSLDQALSKFNKLESKVKDFSKVLNAVNNGNIGNGNGGKNSTKNLEKSIKLYEKLLLTRAKINSELTTLADEKVSKNSNLNSQSINAEISRLKQQRQLLSKEISKFEQNSSYIPSKAEEDSINQLLSESKLRQANLKDLKTGIRETTSEVDALSKRWITFDKVGNRATTYFAQYGAQIKKDARLFTEYNTMMHKLQTGAYATSKDATAAFAEFRLECRRTGIETGNFAALLSKTFGSRVRSALAGQGVYMIQTALRDIVQSSIEVDTAMTELKKVTDLTASGYNDFLKGAQERAAKLGATLTEVINATADYARLGYNVPQATLLANSALIYQNVGDDVENIDDATSALISTMQGFGIAAEDSMNIVDKFNNVSNNYASSAGDIGEMVKRSAASMSAAGNSLEQTIALGVGANEVQQDA